MEGKLTILLLLAILKNAYGSPRVSSRSIDANNSKTSSLVLRNNDDYEENVNFEEPNEESAKYQKHDNSGNGLYERPLSVGDTFTPSELLPVTKRLIEKVDHPGDGKGIVSGARSPEDLADKLFESFFVTKQRIVTLNARDIVGLDALQALALSGQVTMLRQNEFLAPTEAPDEVTLSFRGQTISVNAQPKKSKYRLLNKKDNKIIKKILVRRGGIKLAKKLWQNRHLIVNPGRKHNSAYRFGNNPERSRPKSGKSETRGIKRQRPAAKSGKKYCHWRYHCLTPTDLDTCEVKTDCYKDTPIVEFHGIPHLPDEHTANMQAFRRMLGITLIDEEVEKLLQKRYLEMKPFGKLPGPNMERLESLSEYFNNIIMNDYKKSTEPYTTGPTTEQYQVDADDDVDLGSQGEEQESEPKDGRRNFEKPTRSTPKPSNHNL